MKRLGKAREGSCSACFFRDDLRHIPPNQGDRRTIPLTPIDERAHDEKPKRRTVPPNIGLASGPIDGLPKLSCATRYLPLAPNASKKFVGTTKRPRLSADYDLSIFCFLLSQRPLEYDPSVALPTNHHIEVSTSVRHARFEHCKNDASLEAEVTNRRSLSTNARLYRGCNDIIVTLARKSSFLLYRVGGSNFNRDRERSHASD